jgi:polyhydroxybutyrate depolymerase
VLVVVMAGSGCSSGSAKKAATTTATSTAPKPACETAHQAGLSSQTFDFQGRTRVYEQYVPAAVATADASPMPVVFNFHGYGSTAFQQMLYGNFQPEADRDRFVVIAPQGQGEGSARHFNLTGEPGLQDDVAMVLALLDHLETTFCVDTKRVYSTGMSDGGAMTSALACKAPDRFAAFGAVAVVAYVPGCAGSTPVAIAAFAGTADPVVPFNGGRVNCCGNPTLPGAPDAMSGWAQHNGCATPPAEARLSSEVRRQVWSGCQGAGAVVFYIVDGGGHTWPGAIDVGGLGLTTKQLDASATIWDFLKGHPLAG